MGFFVEYEEEDYYNGSYVSGRKAGKIAHDPTKHYPNKDEAKVLRQLKVKTGLSEEEIRANKDYRKMLSTAQKKGEKAKRDSETKKYQWLIKVACRETKLAKEHPETIKALQELLDSRHHFSYRGDMSKAENVIAKFGKK
jgi:hypothetical protein